MKRTGGAAPLAQKAQTEALVDVAANRGHGGCLAPSAIGLGLGSADADSVAEANAAPTGTCTVPRRTASWDHSTSSASVTERQLVCVIRVATSTSEACV